MSLNLSKTFGLIRPMTRSLLLGTSTLTRFAVNGVEAALALDFIGSEYRTGNSNTTFADAFMGNSPKLTYDPGSASSSQSTMVNSAGNIVWAPHNLALNSASPATQTITVTSGADYTVEVTGTGSMALTGAGTGTATDGSPVEITASTTSLTITLTGSLGTVAVYRSDLGGMAPVPGAVGDFQYYVPTNGNAEYLPRVGHHVYNGSTWVNEGLLIESEPRTNLFPSSNDFTTWAEQTTSGATTGLRYIQENAALGPDGQTSAHKLVESTDNDQQRIYHAFSGMTANTDYTYSVFLKAGERTEAYVRTTGTSGMLVDLSDGTFTASGGSNHDVQPVGNDWYRCSLTVNETGTLVVPWVNISSGGNDAYTGDGTSGIYIWGAQLDQGKVVNGTPVDAPTPSSYIPTNGSTVTRGGQSLVVPPAEFGWPETEYIGPELVDNSGFDTDTDWTKGTGWTISNGVADCDGTQTGNTDLVQALSGTQAGKVYRVSTQLTRSAGSFRFGFYDGAGSLSEEVTESGEVVWYYVAARDTLSVVARGNSAFVGTIDNISVREINPLAVSIQMDGRMTYADEGSFDTVQFLLWSFDGNNQVYNKMDTDTYRTGRTVFNQRALGTLDFVLGDNADYSPGINVPFNISSRHGSTFVNGAVDGVALTANTTPTALPDLSGTDLEIAPDFMGTIGTFRQFAGDIGDAGLVTATNPSTEPTLSLTFDGTGGSFYNLSWSE